MKTDSSITMLARVLICMVVYPGKTHVATAPKHLVDIGTRQVEWLDRYLRDQPSKR